MSIQISSLSVSNGLRSSLQRLQSQLDDLGTEISSGRHADVGLTLGNTTGVAVSYHLDQSSAKSQLASNSLVDGRFDAINKAMDEMRATAGTVSSAAITGLSTDIKLTAAQLAASSALQTLTSSLNTSQNGQYLFSGDNTDQPAANDYTDGAAAKNATTTSFLAYLTSINKTAGTITGTEMQSYLDGSYTDLFAKGTPGAGWSLWSNASDTQLDSRISKTETIQSTVSANDQSFRDLAAGYTMITDLASSTLSTEARATLATAAQAKINKGLDSLTQVQADIGFRQTRIDAANSALTKQQDIMTKSIESLEGVDTAEAGVRLSSLTTQLNASYKAASTILNLSILDYL